MASCCWQCKRARAQYGRTALAEIAREVDGKTEEEVRAYAKAFWERYKELNEWDKVIKNIERGEQRIQRQKARAPARGGRRGMSPNGRRAAAQLTGDSELRLEWVPRLALVHSQWYQGRSATLLK